MVEIIAPACAQELCAPSRGPSLLPVSSQGGLDGAIKVDPRLFRKHIAGTSAPVALDIAASRASDRLFLHVVLANAITRVPQRPGFVLRWPANQLWPVSLSSFFPSPG